MEKIEEKANKAYPVTSDMVAKMGLTFNNSKREGFVRGYTTRNDEVIKMVKGMYIKNPQFPESYHTEGYNQALTDLLTKLKEDKK